MAEQDTEVITKSSVTNQIPERDSSIFGVSVRAWLVLMVVGTLCLTVILNPVLGYLISGDIFFEIKEPFYSVVGLAVGFYFGQSKKA